MTPAFEAGVLTKLAESRDESRYRRAKAHVAKGHEREKERLQSKGRIIGALTGGLLTIGELERAAHGKGMRARALAPIAGAAFGHALGEREALKRLESSQERGEHGHYAPMRKKSSVTSETAANARSQLWATKRSVGTVKPPTHKPKVIQTPQIDPPKIEPSTKTPSQATMVAKLGSVSAIKKLKAKKPVDDLGEGRERLWRGQRLRENKPGPENQPVPESWRSRDF